MRLNQISFLFSFLLAISLVILPDLEAIGKRGGGGGSRGGGQARASASHRTRSTPQASRGGGRSINRSPSLSRSTRQTARQSPTTRPQSRTRPTGQRATARPAPSRTTPTRSQVQNFLKQSPTTRPQAQPSTRPSRRPTTAPKRSEIQQFLKDRPSTKPSIKPETRPQFPDRQPSQRPQPRPERPVTRPEVRPERPVTRPEVRPERPSRPGDSQRPIGRPDRPTRPERPDRPGKPGRPDRDNAQKIRDNIKNRHPERDRWFRGDFWRKHGIRPPYYRYPKNWWRWATPIGIGSWVGWSASPLYYDTYYDDGGYYWGTESYPLETFDYREQTLAIEEATSEDTTISEEDDWLPLGVFALAKEGESLSTPSMYIQLALSKDGSIAGTYYNALTQQTFELEGIVDEETQRAAWKIVDRDQSPIMETGIFNLTESEVPVQVHFSDGRTQEMTLIRLEEP
ncbi:MAG: hypothetical protein Tsb0021_18220 [Chlamydiales bacterium]